LTKFLASLEDEDMAASSVRKVWEAVRAPIVEAIRAKWIGADPTTGIELPRREKGEMLFLSTAEVRSLAEAITPRYRAASYFAAFTGLRAGELWAFGCGTSICSGASSTSGACW
jgi:integrase